MLWTGVNFVAIMYVIVDHRDLLDSAVSEVAVTLHESLMIAPLRDTALLVSK
jgi:hypothetical protein